jgi:hypothetical protein
MTDIRELIGELPAPDQRNLDEMVARILATNDAERQQYAAALMPDWRAWRLATSRLSDEEKCGQFPA